MSNSLIIKAKCPVCDKTAVEVRRIKLGASKLVSLICGHMVSESVLSGTDYSSIKSGTKSLMPYQIDGVKFVEGSNARCLIGDEQGLGKTIQAIATLKLHGDTLFPAIIVTKTTIKQQWMHEILAWSVSQKVQVITSSSSIALPGFDIYVVTYDLLKTDKVFGLITPKSLILDECQAIKNHLSGRAKSVQRLVSTHGIEHIIGLSGTPIKNHAGEYFTILNLLNPKLFPEYSRYLRNHVVTTDYHWSGAKCGGLSNPEHFHELTKDFIIRRTKEEVLPDLPKLSRNFSHTSFEDKKFKTAYEQALKELDELFYAEETSSTMTNMLAVMTKMRQITGISKVEPCVDYVVDFLLSTERKIVVFVHHHIVASMLEDNLNKWLVDGGYNKCLTISADQSAEGRAENARLFSLPENRVLIASTLAAGEGLNLQFCSDAIMLERQWNPANEEQAESRFHRFGQINPVSVNYLIASETIDEYFSELVEKKRAIVAQTLDGKEMNWETNSLMKELAAILVAKGTKKWTL